ncbi:outer membrane efflux protein [Limnobacter thiooxidans]|uniref:TolC family protein n=1 Tax=Limnobacter thiooxidans TaxID=131080 RepID=A0AA86J2U6_9BURK|nr:outer membrane efflux protein [Limnobacter thiooxidans]BET27503.1 TolC family protein [Limnobacter thiooxidans]
MNTAPAVQKTSIALAVLLLAGCATVNINESIEQTNQELNGFTKGQLSLVQTDAQRQAMAAKASDILKEPLSQPAAVELMLTHSPQFQTVLAESWAQAALAAQGGRIHNPVFAFERLRIRDELELGRLLSFGLLDLLSFPARQGIARTQIDRAQLQLTGNVVDQVTQVRQAWVDAVAAQQAHTYAQQVFESAQTSAELARRMQEVGNFTRLQRARQHSFYADAAVNLAATRHKATSSREALVRMLGLSSEQAAQLKLPERLPDLPEAPKAPSEVAKRGEDRLDVRMAKQGFEASVKSQGLGNIASFLDIEAGVRYDTDFENDTGERSNKKGYEIELALPIFDWGGMKRDAMNANTLAAANRLEATLRNAQSTLRESYSAYRTTYDIARHYRDEILPLKQTIADENLLRYNGMFIGVFELLADSRDQVNTVVQAINAQADFWRADAALQATVVGKPMTVSVSGAAANAGGNAGGGH